ncbi:hypothetical protein KAU08_08115, partial [bacterium]|nr:hypothetical protein [bacterium]
MIRTLLILGALIAFCIPVYADIGNELITQILDTDLNGDGIDELIVMEYIDSEGHFTLKINDSSIDEWLEPYLSGFEIVDLDVDDGMIEILIHSPGPSDDPNCLIYAYDGENIIEVGHIWGIRKINSDGSIYIHVWRGFWFATEKYVLIPETHQLEIIPQELYYVDVWFTDQFETPGIVVMEPFPIYRNPDSEEIVEELEVNST